MKLPRHKVALPLRKVIEDTVSKACLAEVERRKPLVFDGSHLEHEEREQMFETLFDKMMESVTATICVMGTIRITTSLEDDGMIYIDWETPNV